MTGADDWAADRNNGPDPLSSLHANRAPLPAALVGDACFIVRDPNGQALGYFCA
jgi:hypothetical protein